MTLASGSAMRQKYTCIVVESVEKRCLHSVKSAAAQLNENQAAF
jgi:hypothetical protein